MLSQDFNYVMSNAFDITLELSCCKHVPSNELQREWFKNKEAMLSYMEATHLGVRGFVLDEERKVVPGATVRVKGINKDFDLFDQQAAEKPEKAKAYVFPGVL